MTQTDIEDILLEFRDEGCKIHIEDLFELVNGEILIDRFDISLNMNDKINNILNTRVEQNLYTNSKRFGFRYHVQKVERKSYDFLKISIRPFRKSKYENPSLDILIYLNLKK